MIDLVWNFPLLEQQKGLWSRSVRAALDEFERDTIESLRPSFRTFEPRLRERAANWLGFPVERTWLTCGGHHGTLNALLASGLAGQRIALEGTSYPGFLDQCRATRTEVAACAVDDDGLIPESLRDLCGRNPVRGVFTMPTVQNPLGFVTPLARRRQIVEIAREFDLTLLEDDAYGFMEEHAPPSYAELAPERTFYVRGLAKSFAPGVRTGFLVASESAAAAIASSLRCTATGTDVPANMAALALCEDGTLDRIMQAKRDEGAIRNRATRDLLGDLCAPGAPSAWHVWVPLPERVDADAVERACNEADVMVSNGKWCAVEPCYGRGLRLALGGEIQRERALEGVARVAEVLHQFVP
jgi:DNA-binding transcriptional MocR family regulator